MQCVEAAWPRTTGERRSRAPNPSFQMIFRVLGSWSMVANLEASITSTRIFGGVKEHLEEALLRFQRPPISGQRRSSCTQALQVSTRNPYP